MLETWQIVTNEISSHAPRIQIINGAPSIRQIIFSFLPKFIREREEIKKERKRERKKRDSTTSRNVDIWNERVSSRKIVTEKHKLRREI